ncbi:antibiotic biosynthesis monooxygenase [Planctomycetales bacterium ZRK34]|nr:antibiotic biosynthesis monooxygenase [Planctomycetales bacterium ZRK34]
MSDSQVTVVARFNAKPGKEDQLRQELLALVPQTRSEPGNINYDLHENPAAPGQFIFYENFASPEALSAHAEQPYLTRMLSLCGELCAEEPDVTTWRMISEKA